MKKQTVLLSLALGAGSLGFANPSTSQNDKNTAQALVNGLTHNGRLSRDEARALRRQSDERLKAKDYNGAMELRWQMLGIRGGDASQLGSLVGSAIQSLALDDIAPIAAHLDAPSCRRFATELADFDAKAPSYGVILRRAEASQLKELAELTRDPQQWQKTVAGLFNHPDEQEELKMLQATPVSRIKANIKTVYAGAIRAAARPYATSEVPLRVDPYTRFFASPNRLERFLWTRDKTQRLLVVAALRARANRMENQVNAQPRLNDPFGTGPLKRKNGFIYSVGPDGKDNGGKFVSGVASKQPDYQGDIPAPAF